MFWRIEGNAATGTPVDHPPGEKLESIFGWLDAVAVELGAQSERGRQGHVTFPFDKSEVCRSIMWQPVRDDIAAFRVFLVRRQGAESLPGG